MPEPADEKSLSSSTSSSESAETKVERILFSILPSSMNKYASMNKYVSYEEEQNSETNWLGWGVGFLMTIGSGGVIGYWAQKNNASASSVLLDRVVSKSRQTGIVSKERKPIVNASTAPIEKKGIISKERQGGIVSKNPSTISSSKTKATPVTTNAKHVAEGHAKKVVEGHVKVSQIAAKALGIATMYAVTGFSLSIVGIALLCGVHSKKDAIDKLDQLKEWGPKARKRFLKSLDISESKRQKESEEELKEVSHLSTEEQFTKIFIKHAEAADAEVAAEVAAAIAERRAAAAAAGADIQK